MGRIKINIIYNSILVASQVLVPIVTFPYVSRVLGPEMIGNVSFVDSICQTIILIAALGIPLYGVREVAKVKNDHTKLSKLVSELLLVHFFSTIICLIPYCLLWFFGGIGQRLLLLPGLIAIMSQIFMVEWLYQGRNEFKYITLRNLIVRLVSIAALFFLVKLEADYVKYFYILCLTVLLNAISNIYLARKFITFSFKNLDLKQHFKPLVFILSSTLAVSIYIYMDSAMLGFLSSPLYVGFYSTSIKLNKIVLSLVTAISAVLVPQIAHSAKENDLGRVNLLLSKSVAYVGIVGAFAMSMMFVFSSDIILIISGQQFLPASITVKILSPIILLIGLNNIFGIQILTTLGHEKQFMKAVIIGMVFSVATNLFLIPWLKHLGTSITTLITETFVTILTFYYCKRHASVGLNLKPVAKYIVISLIAATASYVLYKNLPFSSLELKVLLTSGIAAILYFLILFFLLKDQFVSYGVEFLISVIKRKKTNHERL